MKELIKEFTWVGRFETILANVTSSDQLQWSTQVDRKIFGSRFIAKLGTLIPAGLNLQP